MKTFERNRDVCIFLILPKYQMYFLCRTAFQRLQKMFPVLQKITCFPEDKISQIYPDLQIEQVFNPGSYCTVFPSGASVSVWTLCNSCIWVPQLSSVWKDVSQKHTVILERVQNQRICGTWMIFLKNSGQFNCSGQTMDSWTTITKWKKTTTKNSCGSIR